LVMTTDLATRAMLSSENALLNFERARAADDIARPSARLLPYSNLVR
jgi:hypothetical protein